MTTRAELRLLPEPIAPTLARAVVAALGSGLPEAVVSDAELLTSEVVSNAVTHATLDPSDEVTLRVAVDGNVRVEVADSGPPFEVHPTRPEPGTGGWGLFLVDALAASWGVEAEGSGKKVWFEVGTR